MSTTLLPSIRSRVGDWITYITTMSFGDVARLVKSPDEVHDRKSLSDWIQREAIDVHAEEISSYIQQNPQRFLGALIIGVYDGSPDWAPLNVQVSPNHLEISEEQQDDIEGKLGLLLLSGTEKLFAIDGQHRVAGIKKSLEEISPEDPIRDDEVSAIFVSHDESSLEGKTRTRRLFTTLNKKARRVSKSATIALDEDNGFAIVTRQLIDSHWLFEDDRNHLSYTSSGSIPAQDPTMITSVVGLYEVLKDLYFYSDKRLFESSRPSENQIENYLVQATTFLDLLISKCPEFHEVFVVHENQANYYREEQNHLLFRPVGQRVFARATQFLIGSGNSMEDSITSLLGSELIITAECWHDILWNPLSNTMITNKIVLAETQLLRLANHEARTTKNAQNLQSFLDAKEES